MWIGMHKGHITIICTRGFISTCCILLNRVQPQWSFMFCKACVIHCDSICHIFWIDAKLANRSRCSFIIVLSVQNGFFFFCNNPTQTNKKVSKWEWNQSSNAKTSNTNRPLSLDPIQFTFGQLKPRETVIVYVLVLVCAPYSTSKTSVPIELTKESRRTW